MGKAIKIDNLLPKELRADLDKNPKITISINCDLNIMLKDLSPTQELKVILNLTLKMTAPQKS